MKTFKTQLIQDDKNFAGGKKSSYKTPIYDPKKHYEHLSNSPYYKALLILRHYIKMTSDQYFISKINAKNIDLFMLTSSVSSPIGPGSDSEPLKIKFGKFDTNLVDSSQFGFEPLLLNGLDKVYCYLPSMRGEESDDRHLNQFFHCEMEMIGTLDELIPIIENYVKSLGQTILKMKNITEKISEDPKKTQKYLRKIISIKHFPEITFDQAVELLQKKSKKVFVNETKKGRDITAQGEAELIKILKIETPIWVKYYDRDRVPFYQKPMLNNTEKTINADLLFPAIIKDSFGGEIVGCGERQNKCSEMYKSLQRQGNIPSKPYEWYIDLRRKKKYRTSSGFGIGIERFIAWALGKKSIRDVIPYPRIKNVISYP